MDTIAMTPLAGNIGKTRPEIREMLQFFKPMGFFLIGASEIGFNNAGYLLALKIGAGAKCQAIKFWYKPGVDLYTIDFIKSETDPTQTVHVDMLYAEDIKETIERETGFYLSL